MLSHSRTKLIIYGIRKNKTLHFLDIMLCDVHTSIYLFNFFFFGAMHCTQQILQEILHLDHVVYIIYLFIFIEYGILLIIGKNK